MTTLEPKKTRRPRKPDAKKLNDRIDKFVEKVVDTHVIPYLRWCLDTAQAKTKYPLRFNTAMGSTCLYIEAPWETGGWDTPEEAGQEAAGIALNRMHPAKRAKLDRLEEHFPELLQLFKTVFELEDDVLPDLDPRVPPRPDDGTRDIVDFVEQGPLMGCETPGCQYVSCEDDFIHGPDGRHCEACTNGRGPHRG